MLASGQDCRRPDRSLYAALPRPAARLCRGRAAFCARRSPVRCPPVYVFAYAVFLTAAVVAVVDEAELDDWVSLVTNGALGVTGFYAYRMQRFDLATLAVFGMCSSVVWHSSGKFKVMDEFISRYIAYYAFGTSAFQPNIIGPAVLILVALFTFERQFDETYVLVPLLALVVIYRIGNFTWRFVLAVVVGVVALLCYKNAAWHSLWHVLGAITVALLVEPPQRLPRRLPRRNFQQDQDQLDQRDQRDMHDRVDLKL